MVYIDVGDPGVAKEILSRAQWHEGQRVVRGEVIPGNPDRGAVVRLQKMLDQLAEHYPVGLNGKHGNRHTPTCGCEDK